MARRLSRPRQLGRDLNVLVGARSPADIDPIETAKELGIEVTFGNLSGATARIFQVGGKARIRVSDDIVTLGRRRMSIAHELGHYVLGHELPNEGDAASWFRCSCEHRDPREERDAELLAIEHLTPEPWAKPLCGVTPIDLLAVRVIEQTFKASPVMAAMRFVELSPEACAVVYSEAGRVVWMKPSKTFPRYIAKGSMLAAGTIAHRYFAGGALDPDAVRYGAEPWLADKGSSRQIVEHAILIPEPGWGGVLSLLWVPRFEAVATAVCV